MSTSVEAIARRIGRTPQATFEVARATDTETVEANPEGVVYSQQRRGPIVALNYSKYHAFLPPWRNVVSFVLDGDEKAEFACARHLDTRITGDLKTVRLSTPTISFK